MIIRGLVLAMSEKRIEAKWQIGDVVEAVGMDGARLLAEAGLHCAGCAMARGETLEQGCRAHGFTDAEIKALVDGLNALPRVRKG